jgi:ferritin-like metal-binding protein YciE
MKTLEDLYVDELKDLYSAENQLIKALPTMAKTAKSSQLKSALEDHLRQTEQHARRIEQIFEGLDGKPRGKKCMGMEGLIEEGKELLQMKGEAEPDVIDAGIIGAAQRVEHYEMAGYGTARAHAVQLGHTRDAEILQKTLDEEAAANEKLTQIAESAVNRRAEDGNGDGMRQSSMTRQ